MFWHCYTLRPVTSYEVNIVILVVMEVILIVVVVVSRSQ
jgi:hypothetical protein